MHTLYEHACKQETDIYQHLPTLYSLAATCSSVAELGVGARQSTWAMLAGLADVAAADGRRAVLTSVDIDGDLDKCWISALAAKAGVDYTFIKHDSAKIRLPSPVDLLFIDTWHTCAHLRRELRAHHAMARKYIVMHDTAVDRVHGDSVRCQHDIAQDVQRSGYPEHEVRLGLEPAIVEFLFRHPEWVVHSVYENNNGLTILKRMC